MGIVQHMALLKYLKLKDDSFLPEPQGPLSSVIPSSSAAAANKNMVELLKYRKPKRGTVAMICSQKKRRPSLLEVLLRLESPVLHCIRKLSKSFPDRTYSCTSERTVRTWMNKYKYFKRNLAKMWISSG